MSDPDEGRRRFSRLDDGRIVYRNDWMVVREQRVERDGVAGTYAFVERPDSVVVVPLTPRHRTVLLNQFRFPTRASSWESPMGAANDGEAAAAAARRELMEEVGLGTVEMIRIGEYRPNPGLSPQKATVFLARVDDPMLDRALACWTSSEEIQDVSAVPLPDLAVMIADGRITDGFTLTGFLLVRLWLERQEPRG